MLGVPCRRLLACGFVQVTGHGVPPGLRDAVRSQSRAFFALPDAVKHKYAATIGGRGWLPPGVEANANADPYAAGEREDAAGAAPAAGGPDLKESFALGASRPTGNPDLDRLWFLPNVWPDELPEFAPVAIDYLARNTPPGFGFQLDLGTAFGHGRKAGDDLFSRWSPPPQRAAVYG